MSARESAGRVHLISFGRLIFCVQQSPEWSIRFRILRNSKWNGHIAFPRAKTKRNAETTRNNKSRAKRASRLNRKIVLVRQILSHTPRNEPLPAAGPFECCLLLNMKKNL